MKYNAIIQYLKKSKAYFWLWVYKTQLRVRSLSRKQRILAMSFMLTIVLVIIVGAILKQSKQANYPIHFVKPHKVINQKIMKPPLHINLQPINKNLLDIKQINQHRYDTLSNQLNNLQLSLRQLATNQSAQSESLQLNPALLSKVDTLQNDVKTIIHQTAKNVFLDPKTVNQYFQLVAIQGFSDGMRAIIDVDGNQTTLGIHEICPACRGWSLKSMNFIKQTATFENQHHQFVILHAK